MTADGVIHSSLGVIPVRPQVAFDIALRQSFDHSSPQIFRVTLTSPIGFRSRAADQWRSRSSEP
ncbi:MAG: hypothetical protein AUG05_01950 [Actinobacteria bacterium 13_1_20CM_2_66_18]|nr:MAG: hypothetical protein AUG05_01950 [Actinobacteria bacterium 13_1_20CM_2_66_18]